MQGWQLVVAILVAAASAKVTLSTTVTQGDEAPEFCRGAPCPPFKVISKGSTYELREYSTTTWIATNVSSGNFEVAISKGFVPLYRYLQGNNAAGVKFDMAKPLLTRIRPTDSSYSSSGTEYMMLFYLPDLSKETAPAPLSPNVTVVTSHKQRFYVGVFGGFATGGSTLNAALRLALALTTDGVRFNKTQFYYGLYDAPTRLFGRHNEIFFIPLSDDSTTAEQ